MVGYASGGTTHCRITRELPIHCVEQLRVPISALCEGEACHVSGGRWQVVEGTVDVRVRGFADVDLSQQREQAVSGSLASTPGVEVEPLQNLAPSFRSRARI